MEMPNAEATGPVKIKESALHGRAVMRIAREKLQDQIWTHVLTALVTKLSTSGCQWFLLPSDCRSR